MATRTQTFENHTRYFPLFHFIAAPLLAIYLVYALSLLVRAPSVATAAGVVLAVGVIATLQAARSMALTVQNRMIRLEMTMRIERLLGATAATDALASLTVGNLVALRFASDAELPALIARVRSNELATGREVKRAIREWQPDYLRA
jgi:multisubunit Na+/H+ antiporter MnhB subunit